jgi:hypothetical protein
MNRLVVGCALVLASAAWADIPPSDTSGCRDKTQGATCKRDDGAEGSCAKSTCSRNDYSNGPPPTSVAYECLKCAPAPEKKQSCAAMPGETLFALALLALRARGRKRRDTQQAEVP